MGLLDRLFGNKGGLGDELGQVVSAAIALLNPKDPSVGGGGGLADVIGAFQKAGLGAMVSQWISTGPNPPVSADQVSSALGPDVLGQFARKAGVGHGEAASVLASVLPTLVDRLTPQGQVPAANDLQGALGGLLSSLSAR